MATKFKLFFVAIITTVTIGLAGFVFILQVDAQQTGGLDLNAHCQRHHGSSARAVNIDGTAYGWRCEVNGVRHTMNMDSACVEQHGNWSTAHFRDHNDQNSWYCEIPQQSQQPAQQSPQQSQPPAQQQPPQSGSGVTAVVTVCSSDHGIRSGSARISTSSQLSVRMRTGPSLGSAEIRQLRSGAQFDIISGPRCSDGYVWWEIRHNNRTGWIAEGTRSVSWIERSSDSSTGRTVVATVTIRTTTSNSEDIPVASSSSSSAPQAFVLEANDVRLTRSLNYLREHASVSNVIDSFALFYEFDTTGLVCFVSSMGRNQWRTAQSIDYVCVTIGLATLQPFAYASVLLQPESYIDPWLDPINRYMASTPITCFVTRRLGVVGPSHCN